MDFFSLVANLPEFIISENYDLFTYLGIVKNHDPMKLFVIVFILFFALSCSKKENEPLLKYGERSRIKKIKGYDNEKTFIYNEKGLLTRINNTRLESYEITYNSNNLPVKILPFNNGLAQDYYYEITWGQNQFTFTVMPKGNYSMTCYTLTENKIDKMIERVRSEAGIVSNCSYYCTWFGNDSVYVDLSYYNQTWRDKYKYIGVESIFKNINLAVLIITHTELLFKTYQNNSLEQECYWDNIPNFMRYYLIADRPYIGEKFEVWTQIDRLKFEYEYY